MKCVFNLDMSVHNLDYLIENVMLGKSVYLFYTQALELYFDWFWCISLCHIFGYVRFFQPNFSPLNVFTVQRCCIK